MLRNINTLPPAKKQNYLPPPMGCSSCTTVTVLDTTTCTYKATLPYTTTVSISTTLHNSYTNQWLPFIHKGIPHIVIVHTPVVHLSCTHTSADDAHFVSLPQALKFKRRGDEAIMCLITYTVLTVI